MSDLGAPGGTRPIPNASERHTRARTTRDPAAPRPVSSRTRPRRAKAGARAFPETTTDIALPRPPPKAPPRTARRAPSRTSRYDRAAFPGTVRRTRLARCSPRDVDRPRTTSRAPRARPSVPPAHRPFRPTKIPLALHPQAKLSRPSGSGGSPAPSAARTRKPRLKRYVASLPSSAVADAVPADARSTQISPRVKISSLAARTEDVLFFRANEPASSDLSHR